MLLAGHMTVIDALCEQLPHDDTTFEGSEKLLGALLKDYMFPVS